MLSSPALKELQKLINFTQIRFNCFKANKGREIDLATAKNTSGYTVVKYFTGEIDDRPTACKSYEYFPSDTSKLKTLCQDWGYSPLNKWSIYDASKTNRIYIVPIYAGGRYHFVPHIYQGVQR